MNRFIIVDGLPYLYANGKAYAVRWDDAGFTVGAEVELKSAPAAIYNERSIKAKYAACLDSIRADQEEQPEQVENPEQADEPEQPEQVEKPKKASRKLKTSEA